MLFGSLVRGNILDTTSPLVPPYTVPSECLFDDETFTNIRGPIIAGFSGSIISDVGKLLQRSELSQSVSVRASVKLYSCVIN